MTALPSDIRATAIQLRQLGMNVNLLDGNKQPIHKWKCDQVDYTKARQSAAQFADLPWTGYTRKRDGVVIPPPVGVAIVNGIDDVRTLDLDKRADPALVSVMLAAMGLPADYGWVTLSGSHQGNGIAVRCADAIPESLLGVFSGGILIGTPRDGAAFKQLELRYSGCQTVMPPSLHPSGNRYEWLHGEPTTEPSVVTFDQLLAGFLAIAELPTPKPTPEVKLIQRMTPRDTTPDTDVRHIIDRVNVESTTAYLERRGSTKGRDGNYICICGAAHTGKGQITIGRTVVFCHSNNPGCKLSKDRYPRGLDRWGLEVALDYDGDQRAALVAHGWQPPEPRGNVTSKTTSAPTYSDAQRAAYNAKERARKAAIWQQEVATLHTNVAQRADADDRLTPCDCATLSVMLAWADEHHAVGCKLGRASIAERASYSYGAVKRSVMHLEALGYFTSTGNGGRSIDTAWRNFSRGSSFIPETLVVAENDPRIVYKLDLSTESDLTCEGAAQPEAEHSADELSELDFEPPLTYSAPDTAQQALCNDLLTRDAAAFAAWFAGHSTNADPDQGSVCNLHTESPAEPDTAGASYVGEALIIDSPHAIPSWLRPVGDVAMERKPEADEQPAENLVLLDVPEPEPLVRCPPAEPEKAARYYRVRAKAAHASSPGQRIALNRVASGMEEWVPLSEAIGAGLGAPLTSKTPARRLPSLRPGMAFGLTQATFAAAGGD